MPETSPPRLLTTRDLTPEAFAPYGQIVAPMEDGVPFGEHDAQLVLGNGTPRFYVMRLDWRPLGVRRITRHLRVTQCLAAVGGKPWWIVVAPPAPADAPQTRPALETIQAFHVPGDVAIKLHVGTWHGGPYFGAPEMCFFNLELADTNLVDHDNLYLQETYGQDFELVPSACKE